MAAHSRPRAAATIRRRTRGAPRPPPGRRPVAIEWQAETGPTSWDVYTGDLDVLRGTGVYTQAPGSNPLADRFCDLPTTSVADPVVPAAGKVEFVLVTGKLGGIEGSLGTESDGTERPNTNPCP